MVFAMTSLASVSYTHLEAIHAALWDYAEKHNIKIEGLEKPKNDISEGLEEEDY